jgi:hypothetical protein
MTHFGFTDFLAHVSRTMIGHACHCVPAATPTGELIEAVLPRLR